MSQMVFHGFDADEEWSEVEYYSDTSLRASHLVPQQYDVTKYTDQGVHRQMRKQKHKQSHHECNQGDDSYSHTKRTHPRHKKSQEKTQKQQIGSDSPLNWMNLATTSANNVAVYNGRVGFSTQEPMVRNYDPVDYIMDRIDAEIGEMGGTQNMSKSKPTRHDREQLKEEGVLFDTGDEKSRPPPKCARRPLRRATSRASLEQQHSVDVGPGYSRSYDAHGSRRRHSYKDEQNSQNIVGQAHTYSETGSEHTTSEGNTTSLSDDDELQSMPQTKSAPHDLDSDTALQVNQNYKDIMKTKQLPTKNLTANEMPRLSSLKNYSGFLLAESGLESGMESARTEDLQHAYWKIHKQLHGAGDKKTSAKESQIRATNSKKRKKKTAVRSSRPSNGQTRPRSSQQPSKHTSHAYPNGGGSGMPQKGLFPSDDLESVRTEDFENQFNNIMAKQVANVPLNNFDQMLIDSDLDTVTSQMAKDKFWTGIKHHPPIPSGSDITDASSDAESHRDTHRKHRQSRNGPLFRSSSFNNRQPSSRHHSESPAISRNVPVDDYRMPSHQQHQQHQQHHTVKSNNFSFLASTLPSTSPTSQHRNDHHQTPTESLEETFRGSHYSMSPRDHSVKEYLHKKPPHDILRGRQRSRSEEVDLRMQLKEEKERRRTGQGFGKDEQRISSRHSHRSGSCGASVSGTGGGSVDKSLDSTLSQNQASSGGVIHQLSVELNRLHAAIAKAESLKQTRLLELKAVEETLVGNKTEAKQCEQVLKQTRAQAEEKRSELMLIEFKRDAAQKEIRGLCEEVDRRKAQIGTLGDLAVKERQAMKNASLAQEQVETLQCDAEQLQLRLKTLESAERERIELEKQLSSTKENLFAEQRRSREKIESFREDLEHHQLQLEEAIKEKEALQMKVFQFESRVQQIEREKNAIIEEKGEEMGKLQQKLAERLSDARTHNSREMTDLKVQLKDARSKVNEATNQKQEIEMKGENLREKYDNARSALSKLSQEVEQLKGKQEKQLEDILQQKDTELASLRLAAEQDKEAALAALSQQRDQIASQIQMKLREDLAALQKQLTAKEVEATVLKERLKEQDDTTRHLNDTIRQEVKDNMQNTIEKERIKIERDVSELYKSKMAAIQDQANKTVFSLEEQMKVEREGTLQLQTMVNNIKQELDDARRQSHSLYNDKLTAIQQAKDTAEQDRERQLERMKEKIEQDYQRQIAGLTETNRTQGEELERLRAEREVLIAHEREQTDEAGRLERSVVQEANDECKKMADFTGLPPRITTAQGLNMNWSSTKGSYNQTIRSAIPIAISNMKHSGEEIRKVVTSLRNDLNNQKIKMSRVEQDKPADHTFHMPVSASTGPSSESHAPSGLAHSGSMPSVGQFHSGSQAPHVRHSNSSPNYVHTSQTESLESLRMRLLQEKQQSMDSLKDRLIKEHVHEVDRLHKTLSHAPKLSRSLKEKDSELKEIVRNMSSWKDQTADKLASKFQKEMDREIERHVRDFERKERAWEREKVSQQRDIERLESEIQKPKILSHTVSPTYRSPVKCFHDDQVPNNKLGVHDDDNVERLHTLQSKMSLLQRENDNLKHMNGTLGKPAEMHTGNVSGLQAYNDTIPTRDVNNEHTLGSPAPKVLEQRLGMAERRARMSEQRADQNEQLLNQKILEMTKLQGTLSQQSKELMQVERAYSHLHTTLSGSPITSRSPSRSDSRIGSRHGSRPSSLPNSRPSSRNSHPVSTR